ncbi:MAG: TIGR00299 family protein [Acidobacteria bacterium RIFCSPLOWO2_02_FULL_68_18]|nr:MAG: TIGR00299 family protein [Acidobacteria bacterium RIFCSPLOWO2_02_FULL_68_18]OFW49884.1 MAG: TIGR00299 family protein [Acidobacteria bacterium RIFCSPLOWO2_12_FULL_68_19]
MTILYFDCFSGAAGDMILGALIDAGLSLDDVRRALGSLAVEPETVWTEAVTRAGMRATKLHVRGEGEPAGSHGHAHRTLAEIERSIDGSALSAAGKARARSLFARLAAAEAAVHGTSPERVHLHEVGARDSIVDIVGTVYGMEALGVEQVAASPLNVGNGTIQCAHGLYPVPGPATARLLEGAPIYAGTQNAELLTPTGALLVTSYAQSYGSLPPMRLRRTGCGAGSRDFAGSPNVLRVFIGETDATSPVRRVVVIEAEIDDMNPQIFGVLMDRLMAAGALDVFYTAIQMKKSRPGTLLSIVAPPEARDPLTSLVFRETTTIGVRYAEMERDCLERETIAVSTRFGPVRVKLARRNGALLNAAPEFDDCVRIAADTGTPLKDVQAAAVKAFLDGQH